MKTNDAETTCRKKNLLAFLWPNHVIGIATKVLMSSGHGKQSETSLHLHLQVKMAQATTYMQTGFDVHPYNRTGLQKKFDNVLWIGSGSTFICWTKTTKSVLYLGHDLIWNPSSFYHLFSLGFIYSTCMPCIICYLQTDNDLQNDVVWYLPICKRRGIF